jgi:hypothetical protein
VNPKLTAVKHASKKSACLYNGRNMDATRGSKRERSWGSKRGLAVETGTGLLCASQMEIRTAISGRKHVTPPHRPRPLAPSASGPFSPRRLLRLHRVSGDSVTRPGALSRAYGTRCARGGRRSQGLTLGYAQAVPTALESALRIPIPAYHPINCRAGGGRVAAQEDITSQSSGGKRFRPRRGDS